MSKPTYERLSPNPAPAQVARVVNDIRDGKVDAGGQMTMLDGTVSTVVRDLRLTEQSIFALSPRSAAAAAVEWWVDEKERGKITIGHSSVGDDLAFDWLALG